MSTANQIGIITSKTDKLQVQRQGEQLTLRQGDAILAGDVVQNKDTMSVDIQLPAQQAGQADSLVTLAPESAAQITSNPNADGAMLEVTSLTDGVELYAISEGTDGAMLIADSGTGVSGLVGAGLLSAGSSLGGLATVIGGGVGVAALAVSSGDNANTVDASGFTDVRVDNGDDTGAPETDPDGSENPETPVDPEDPAEENPDTEEPNPDNPDEPVEEPEEPTDPVEPEEPVDPVDPVDQGITGTPLDLLLEPLAEALGETPLSVITDPLFDALGSLPIGSTPNPTDSLPLDTITGNLPI